MKFLKFWPIINLFSDPFFYKQFRSKQGHPGSSFQGLQISVDRGTAHTLVLDYET